MVVPAVQKCVVGDTSSRKTSFVGKKLQLLFLSDSYHSNMSDERAAVLSVAPELLEFLPEMYYVMESMSKVEWRVQYQCPGVIHYVAVVRLFACPSDSKACVRCAESKMVEDYTLHVPKICPDFPEDKPCANCGCVAKAHVNLTYYKNSYYTGTRSADVWKFFEGLPQDMSMAAELYATLRMFLKVQASEIPLKHTLTPKSFLEALERAEEKATIYEAKDILEAIARFLRTASFDKLTDVGVKRKFEKFALDATNN